MKAACLIARKDLRLVLSRGAGLVQALLLGLLLIFVFSLSRETGETMSGQGAATIFWLSSAFCQVLSFNMLYGLEEANGSRAGLLLLPTPVQSVLLGKAAAEIPTYLDYKIHADNGSMYNTPPCFSIYVAGEVFKYLKRIGGIKEMERRNKEKAAMLYDYIDASSLYKCPVAEEDRSLMNVVFVTGDAELDKKFVAQAKEKGLVNLAGHRSIGGMRASIYNAMPKEGVEALIQFMKEFEEKNK